MSAPRSSWRSGHEGAVIADLDGKVCVITGATSGIGKETARALAESGATVALIGRNLEKARRTLEELSKTAKHPQRLRYFGADLADLAQVRKLAETLHHAYDRIDVLVNNAGAIHSRRHVTADEFELSFGVNHLAHFLLTGLVLDLVKKAAPSRIVNLSSGAHLNGHIGFDDLQFARRYSGFAAYSQSKLANVLFTRELARRLAGQDIAVNAVHPGSVQTGFAQNNRSPFQYLVWLMGPLMLTPKQGADTVVFAASAPEMQAVTGEYLYKRQPARMAAEARDDAVAARLWDVSEKLTGAPFAAAGI
ncbi:MAG: SDR family oxidoreductase [Cucumibacter sp.]